MSDIYHKTNADDDIEFQRIAEDPLKEVANERRRLRSIRRAIAINAVTTAREHAGTNGDPYSQSDADVIMAIMELLDRVAGQ